MQNKNLKLKLGLCGLALTSFLALNAHSTVHADTVQNNNTDNNAITWDSDSDDSQVVKEQSEQQTAPQSVQRQSTVQASQSQPVQNKKIMVSDVSSVSVSQKRAEASIVRQSNVQTSTVNRLNANKKQANIKVSNVQDVAQAPVQKQKVAQFNQGSKIYTLNGSNQLSKNNGDGYVITNAGIYNGRAVDIGVTINNVQDNQGTYTTKWSNGDNADVTGKTDASFNYQNSVLAGTQQNNVTVPDQTRQRTANVTHNYTLKGAFVGAEVGDDGRINWYSILSPTDLAKELARQKIPVTDEAAVARVAGAMLSSSHTSTDDLTGFYEASEKYDPKTHQGVYTYHYESYSNTYDETFTLKHVDLSKTGSLVVNDKSDVSFVNFIHNVRQPTDGTQWEGGTPTYYDSDEARFLEGGPSADDTVNVSSVSYNDNHVKLYQNDLTGSIDYSYTSSDQVTDHLQLANKTDANLNYNYTVGLYDAQTGELITDLKAEYNSKAGVQATAKDSVMNNAIKSKIQQINNNQATVSYTGAKANDDVAFYKETRAVNPQDQALHKSATRIISVNLPDDPDVKDRYKGILNANNQIVQTINFTRTGTENIVSGQVTYGAWTGPSSFGAVTLPDIPGYTMTMN